MGTFGTHLFNLADFDTLEAHSRAQYHAIAFDIATIKLGV